MSRWFRFYDAVLDDPKVQRLPDHLFRGWVNILCLASERKGVLPSLEDIAFRLRVTDDRADSLIQSLLTAGLLEDCGEHLRPHNWEKRQFVDKTNAKRQQRFRDKKLKQKKSITAVTLLRNAKITPTDTDTDTDTEKETRVPRLCAFGDEDFDRNFWPAYPNKVGKPSALKAWLAARTRGHSVEMIIAGLDAYLRTKPVDRPWLNPATFLNQDRFLDQPAQVSLVKRERDLRSIPDSQLSTDDYWRKRKQMREADKEAAGGQQQSPASWVAGGLD